MNNICRPPVIAFCIFIFSNVLFSSDSTSTPKTSCEDIPPSDYVAATNFSCEKNMELIVCKSNNEKVFLWCEKNNKKSGLTLVLNKDKKIISETYYFNNKPDGKHRDWYPSGKIKTEGSFLKGQPHDKVISWFENGQIELEGFFDNGKKTSKWTKWDNNGKQISISKWDNDLKIYEISKGSSSNSTDSFWIYFISISISTLFVLIVYFIFYKTYNLIDKTKQIFTSYMRGSRKKRNDRQEQSDGEQKHSKQNNTEQKKSHLCPYDVLQVSQNATIQEIKDAYKKLILQYHPDRVNHLGIELQAVAEEKTRNLNWAVETLLNTNKQ